MDTSFAITSSSNTRSLADRKPRLNSATEQTADLFAGIILPCGADFAAQPSAVRMHHGDHACVIYSTGPELIAEASQFLNEGLLAAEQCWYAGAPDELSGIRAALGRWDVNVPAAEECGALRLLTSDQMYLADGTFDPEQTLHTIDEAIPAAIEDGFTGLRIAGEMSWALEPKPGTARVTEYESSVEMRLRESAALAMCFYHRHRMPPALLDGALASHSLAAVGGQVRPNAFYRPKPIADLRTPQAEDISWKLKHLQRRSADARL